jgi:hypothetical protein
LQFLSNSLQQQDDDDISVGHSSVNARGVVRYCSYKFELLAHRNVEIEQLEAQVPTGMVKKSNFDHIESELLEAPRSMRIWSRLAQLSSAWLSISKYLARRLTKCCVNHSSSSQAIPVGWM